MFQLINLLISLAVYSPQPSDFNLAYTLLNDNCPFKDLREVVPVKKIIYNFHQYNYEGWEPSWKYERLYRAFAIICTNLELTNGREWGYNNLIEFRERLKLYHKYPNPEKFNFNIPNYQINKNRLFALAYRDYLETRMKIGLDNDRERLLSDAHKEAHELYLFWDSMTDASVANGYNLSFAQRKNALIRVYDFLGEENFYNGVYPPAAPFWQFNWY